MKQGLKQILMAFSEKPFDEEAYFYRLVPWIETVLPEASAISTCHGGTCAFS
jgi:hypothetical protein